MRLWTWHLAAALLLAGCALPQAPSDPAVVPVLLLGEQHDAAEHQRLHRDVIDTLSGRGLLAAVVLEMAEHGRSTAALPASADEQQVRDALGWQGDRGWPWADYAPAIMTAVRAGVPVLGANITREEMRSARTDAALEQLVPPQALRITQDGIRAGHCDLLPPAQLAPMARIQIARDRAMARTVVAAVAEGKTVVLLAGSGHVDPEVGVPLHLPAGLRVQPVLLPRVDLGKDYCGELREQLRPPAKGS
jgi:uncharacterized iron-regulated protein